MPVDPRYLQAVDDLEGEVSQDEILEYAKSKDLDFYKLLIYKQLFEIYDEGEFDCVVVVQTVSWLNDS